MMTNKKDNIEKKRGARFIDVFREVVALLQEELASYPWWRRGWLLVKPLMAGAIPVIGSILYMGYYAVLVEDFFLGKKKRLLRFPWGKRELLYGTTMFIAFLFANGLDWISLVEYRQYRMLHPSATPTTFMTFSFVISLFILCVGIPVFPIVVAYKGWRGVLSPLAWLRVSWCSFPAIVFSIVASGIIFMFFSLGMLSFPHAFSFYVLVIGLSIPPGTVAAALLIVDFAKECLHLTEAVE